MVFILHFYNCIIIDTNILDFYAVPIIIEKTWVHFAFYSAPISYVSLPFHHTKIRMCLGVIVKILILEKKS